MDKPPVIKIELECKHERWFRRTYVPNSGDRIWCPACDDYREAANANLNVGRTYHAEDDFWSEPTRAYKGGRKFKGHCTHTDEDNVECGHEFIERNFYKLREHMHTHYMRTHTRFGGLTFTYIPREEPDF